jgi:hypothetical protein
MRKHSRVLILLTSGVFKLTDAIPIAVQNFRNRSSPFFRIHWGDAIRQGWPLLAEAAVREAGLERPLRPHVRPNSERVYYPNQSALAEDGGTV